MARVDTLGHFLTDVADAIREKKGTSETIQASDFDTEIANLPSGGGDYNIKADMTKRYNTIYGMSSLITEIAPIDTSNITNMTGMFIGFQNLTTIPLIDTSNVTKMENMFSYCTGLTTIPLLNTSKVTSTAFMFRNCSSLTEVPLLDISNVAAMQQMFTLCSNLTTVPQLNLSKALNISNMFNGCTSLTDESLNNILAMCININPNYSGTKTLAYMGIINTNYFPVERIMALSNYQAFIDAGWTIGY